MQVFALVDGNSFFASCEKVFRPDLTDRPVIVLSNNDGCVVARSKEAKQLGIKMCQPYFQIEEFCIRENVSVFLKQLRTLRQSLRAHDVNHRLPS